MVFSWMRLQVRVPWHSMSTLYLYYSLNLFLFFYWIPIPHINFWLQKILFFYNWNTLANVNLHNFPFIKFFTHIFNQLNLSCKNSIEDKHLRYCRISWIIQQNYTTKTCWRYIVGVKIFWMKNLSEIVMEKKSIEWKYHVIEESSAKYYKIKYLAKCSPGYPRGFFVPLIWNSRGLVIEIHTALLC